MRRIKPGRPLAENCYFPPPALQLVVGGNEWWVGSAYNVAVSYYSGQACSYTPPSTPSAQTGLIEPLGTTFSATLHVRYTPPPDSPVYYVYPEQTVTLTGGLQCQPACLPNTGQGFVSGYASGTWTPWYPGTATLWAECCGMKSNTVTLNVVMSGNVGRTIYVKLEDFSVQAPSAPPACSLCVGRLKEAYILIPAGSQAVVSGRVVTESTGEPVANAPVDVVLCGKSFNALTDSDGYFSATVTAPTQPGECGLSVFMRPTVYPGYVVYQPSWDSALLYPPRPVMLMFYDRVYSATEIDPSVVPGDPPSPATSALAAAGGIGLATLAAYYLTRGRLSDEARRRIAIGGGIASLAGALAAYALTARAQSATTAPSSTTPTATSSSATATSSPCPTQPPPQVTPPSSLNGMPLAAQFTTETLCRIYGEPWCGNPPSWWVYFSGLGTWNAYDAGAMVNYLWQTGLFNSDARMCYINDRGCFLTTTSEFYKIACYYLKHPLT